MKSHQWKPSFFTFRRTDGRTDITKIIVAFRIIANAPKACYEVVKIPKFLQSPFRRQYRHNVYILKV